MGRTKDPEKPKRYMSAFFLFLNDFRQKNHTRGYSNTEMTKKGATVWKTLTNREKQPYADKSAKLKEKYDRDFQKYQEKLKLMGKSAKVEDIGSSKRKQKRDPNKPKKALTAYMLFMQDFRKKNASRGWDVTEMVSKGASVWKTLTSNERYPYESAARKNQEKYHTKLEKYKQQQKPAMSSSQKTSANKLTPKPSQTPKATKKNTTKSKVTKSKVQATKRQKVSRSYVSRTAARKQRSSGGRRR